MDLKYKRKRADITVAFIYLYAFSSLLFFQCCSLEDTSLYEKSDTEEPVIKDSKAYFESLVVQNMENQADLDNTLYPGEITPLWEDAYANDNGKYEYLNVPILSDYTFVVRKDISTAKVQKIRHVEAEQVISFRKAKDTGEIKAMYMTFVPSPWYFNRHKGNVAESFFSKENYGDFSGYILYNSSVEFSLQFIVEYKDGKVFDKALRENFGSTDAFRRQIKQMTYNDIFIKKYVYRTKSNEEDDDVIDGGSFEAVDIYGNLYTYVPGSEYVHDPWGEDDGFNWDTDQQLEALDDIAAYVYFDGPNKQYVGILASELNALLQGSPLAKVVYDLLKRKGVRINFALKYSSTGSAYYNPSNKTLYFATISDITRQNLFEELFHALQDACYSGGIAQYGTTGYSNIEFEAKLYKDVANYGCCTMFPNLDFSDINQAKLFDDYEKLLARIRATGSSGFTPESYKSWVDKFRSYNGSTPYNKPTSPDFSDTDVLNYVLNSR